LPQRELKPMMAIDINVTDKFKILDAIKCTARTALIC